MKKINVSKQQLIEVIAESTKDFGSPFIAIVIDDYGFSYCAEGKDSSDHIIMTLSGLEEYTDKNGNTVDSDDYDSEGVAEHIIDNENFINLELEYEFKENVLIEIA